MRAITPKYSPTPTHSPHATREESDAEPSHDRVEEERMEETDRPSFQHHLK